MGILLSSVFLSGVLLLFLPWLVQLLVLMDPAYVHVLLFVLFLIFWTWVYAAVKTLQSRLELTLHVFGLGPLLFNILYLLWFVQADLSQSE